MRNTRIFILKSEEEELKRNYSGFFCGICPSQRGTEENMKNGMAGFVSGSYKFERDITCTKFVNLDFSQEITV
jgi:hypothetical protein